MPPALAERRSLNDFLRWEDNQSERHEFVEGEVYAMVGTRRVHGEVVRNLLVLLSLALKGSGCRVYSESLKLQVRNNIFYPDVFVSCDARDLATESVFAAPRVIVEVLSPSTENYDRGLKFAYYRALESLQEYVIVDADLRRFEVFRLQENGVFGLFDYSDHTAAKLQSLEIVLSLSEVFEGLDPA